MGALEGKTLQTCSICSDKTLGERLGNCPGCGRKDICEGCFLKERNGSGKRCLECAVPFCKDCGWEGGKTSDLQYIFVLEQNLGLVCPVCDSPNISPIIDGNASSTKIPDVFTKFLSTLDLTNI